MPRGFATVVTVLTLVIFARVKFTNPFQDHLMLVNNGYQGIVVYLVDRISGKKSAQIIARVKVWEN